MSGRTVAGAIGTPLRGDIGEMNAGTPGDDPKGGPMDVKRLDIPDILLVTPVRHTDPRGFFSETWNQASFAAAGIPGPFVQDNHSVSEPPGVVRGLHLQIGANAQGKLVRVVRGAAWDVAVDMRPGSPTHG